MIYSINFAGIAKAFVVPGWRVGWLVIHDKGTGRLNDLSVGIRNLTQLILGEYKFTVEQSSIFTLQVSHYLPIYSSFCLCILVTIVAFV